MDEIEQLEHAISDCDKNMANIVAHLQVVADAIKLPQCPEVLSNLLIGRDTMQKALKSEYDKSRQLYSQLAILQGCDDV